MPPTFTLSFVHRLSEYLNNFLFQRFFFSSAASDVTISIGLLTPQISTIKPNSSPAVCFRKPPSYIHPEVGSFNFTETLNNSQLEPALSCLGCTPHCGVGEVSARCTARALTWKILFVRLLTCGKWICVSRNNFSRVRVSVPCYQIRFRNVASAVGTENSITSVSCPESIIQTIETRYCSLRLR